MGRRGAFIVFEGIDGSGKSTHTQLLCRELSQSGHRVLQTAEPSEGRIGRFIRENVERGENRLPSEVEALLFAADRFEHVKNVIEPALMEGQIVVSDRYLHSSLAYQGAEGLSLEWIREMNRFALKPDLCLLLDVSPDAGLARLGRRRKTLFEAYGFQQKVRNLYLQFVEQGEMTRIDASGHIQEVQKQVLPVVKRLLERLGM